MVLFISRKVLAATDADADEEGAMQTKSGSKHSQVPRVVYFHFSSLHAA